MQFKLQPTTLMIEALTPGRLYFCKSVFLRTSELRGPNVIRSGSSTVGNLASKLTIFKWETPPHTHTRATHLGTQSVFFLFRAFRATLCLSSSRIFSGPALSVNKRNVDVQYHIEFNERRKINVWTKRRGENSALVRTTHVEMRTVKTFIEVSEHDKAQTNNAAHKRPPLTDVAVLQDSEIGPPAWISRRQ